MMTEEMGVQRLKLGKVLHASDPAMTTIASSNYGPGQSSSSSAAASSHRQASSSTINYDSGNDSPYSTSPWHNPNNPSPSSDPSLYGDPTRPALGLVGSLEREKGHVYSMAASGDLLFTGSDSKNVRVWKDLKEFSGFKSTSGLVKAIVLYGDKIFTGHQDGKIRVWKASGRRPSVYKRVGSLPRFKDLVKKSINPKNFVDSGRRNRNALRIRHFDAISCMCLDEDEGLMYSGSWDRTVKCWRISDSKCLESIPAHDDAVNSVVFGFDSLVFTGSADGKVKAWRREVRGKGTSHGLDRILLDQESAVTALAVSREAGVVYSGSSGGVVNFWGRVDNFGARGSLGGHRHGVLCLAVARALLFSGSADKSIFVWRREEEGGAHARVMVLTGHSGPVKCLAVVEDPRPNGGFDQRWVVYSGSLDRSVKVWRVSEKPHAPEEEEESDEDETNGYGSEGESDYEFGRRLQVQ